MSGSWNKQGDEAIAATDLCKCRLEIGESALVTGQGVLGQIAVKLLKAVGAAPIVEADPVSAKREEALKPGADFAFDPLAPDFAERVRAVTDLGRKTIWRKTEDWDANRSRDS